MDKDDVVYMYNGILLSHKKEQNNATCSNMDGPRDDHTKQSKSDKEKQISYDITHMWNLILKYEINELFTKQKKNKISLKDILYNIATIASILQ